MAIPAYRPPFRAGEAAAEGFGMPNLSQLMTQHSRQSPIFVSATIRREFHANFLLRPMPGRASAKLEQKLGAIRPAKAFYRWDGPVQHWFRASELPYEVE